MGLAAPSTRKLLSFLNIFLLAALVAAGLLFARDAVILALKGGTADGAAENRAAAPAERGARKPLEAYAPIVSDNVFGMPPGKLTALSAGKAAGPGPAEAPKLDVTVLGTVAWSDGFGYAIVAEGSGDQQVYRAGQYLKGGGVLSKVYKDRITIKSGGRETDVPLVEVAPVKEVSRPASRPSARAEQPADAAAGLQGFARKTADNAYLVDRDAVEAALQDPRQIMTDARLLPNTVEGKQEGFVIREVRPGGVYDKLGLENGDVLLRVNEFSISDPETALQVFTALRGMERVELDVLRNGSRMTLTYTIR